MLMTRNEALQYTSTYTVYRVFTNWPRPGAGAVTTLTYHKKSCEKYPAFARGFGFGIFTFSGNIFQRRKTLEWSYWGGVLTRHATDTCCLGASSKTETSSAFRWVFPSFESFPWAENIHVELERENYWANSLISFCELESKVIQYCMSGRGFYCQRKEHLKAARETHLSLQRRWTTLMTLGCIMESFTVNINYIILANTPYTIVWDGELDFV